MPSFPVFSRQLQAIRNELSTTRRMDAMRCKRSNFIGVPILRPRKDLAIQEAANSDFADASERLSNSLSTLEHFLIK